MERYKRSFIVLTLIIEWICMIDGLPIIDNNIERLVLPGQFITAGDSVQLSCTTPESEYVFHSWVHPRLNATELIGAAERFTQNNHENINRYELILNSPTEEDSGTYMCVFTNQSGELVAQNITVYYQDPVIFLTSNGLVHHILAGSNASIECLAENYEIIQWQNHNNVIITSPSERVHMTEIDGGRELVFIHAVLQDSGTYDCYAINKVTTQSRIQAFIQVHAIPSVMIKPSMATARESGNVSFACSASGFPQLSAMWYKGSISTSPLNSSLSEAMTLDEYNITIVSTLHLSSVQLQDSDIYYCEVSYYNESLSRVASAILNITYCQALPEQIEAHLIGHLRINVTWHPPVCYGMEYPFTLTINWKTEIGSTVQSHTTIQDPINITYFVITNVDPQTVYYISISAGEDTSDLINVTTGMADDISKQSSTLTVVLVAVGIIIAIGFLLLCGLLLALAMAYYAKHRRKTNKYPNKINRTAPRSLFPNTSGSDVSTPASQCDKVTAVYSPCPLLQTTTTDSSHKIADFSGFTSDVILIPSTCLSIHDLIGQGEFGIVFKAQLKQSNTALPLTVAVKTLKGFLNHTKIMELLMESMKMKDFDHPNVLSLIGICVDGGPAPYIVMPFMANGSLLSYLRKERESLVVLDKTNEEMVLISQKKLLDILLQIAKGMEYLASKGVLHRDLAARNCMIDINFVVKVADFGLSESVYSKNYFRNEEQSEAKLPVKWMAPESLTDGVFTEKTDVWSFGVTFWEVCTGGKIPYPAVSPWSLPQHLEQGQRLTRPLNVACTDDMHSVMESCWDSDPKQRPSFSQLVSTIGTHLSTLGDYLQL